MSRAVPYRVASQVRLSQTHWLILGVALSRALILELGALAYANLPHAFPMFVPGYKPPTGGYWSSVLLAPWAHWDGYWYLSIAHFGYIVRESAAFFPLYPLLVHVLGSTVYAALAISTAAFGVGLWCLYQLAEEELGRQAAWFSVLVLAYFPASFYLTAAYPEALVLALSTGSLLAARRGHYGWAAVLAGITSAASVYGVVLAIPIGLYVWRAHRPFPTYLWILLVPSGLAAFMAKLYVTFGNPLEFKLVQPHYWGRHLAWPWQTLYWGGRLAARYFRDFVSFPQLFSIAPPDNHISNVWNIAFLAFGILLLVLGRRYLSWPLWWYAFFVLLVPFLYPASQVPLMSAPRFLLASSPLFIVLGAWVMERPWALRIYVGTSLLLGALFISLFTTFHWVA